jgi:uncharacterized protein YqeY
MNIRESITAQMKKAMMDKDSVKLGTLRSIKAKISEAETAKGASELGDEGIIKLIGTLAKQRRQSVDAFEQGGREDLAQSERQELAILESFLPKQLSEDEVREVISGIIEKTGASSMGDMGNVMKEFNSEYAGQADGKTVSTIVREILF